MVELYTMSDLQKMTGLSKAYLYASASKIVGYAPLKDSKKPGKHRVIRFRKADVDFALETGKPLIRE